MFQLHPLSADDLPALVALWYDSFSIPINLRLFPDTAGVRAWLEGYHRVSLDSPDQHYLKITLDSASSPLVAIVKWDFNTTAPGHRFPAWHDESDRAFCDAFFGSIDKARRKIMGTRQHYYLDTLLTHPGYQRQGAGSMLIRWGCDRADHDGLPIWVDASPEGAVLYQRFGFRDVSVPGVTPEGAVSMLRDPIPADAS
ncbi:acyl-CoA N-acyltransferase [Aspergillus sclerotioniger CBS 115572]|uniref:Acyl-CoA N-acyltransferase n=1 Tax=Aspergillus sclerotioniger CBS 115572 TaxID=1450535 RepID=A0A317VNP1_9EURO|nr:acyl-CoA N-acyltransferase [Aspergillus sclerotioniger CBS 115572]PWY75984.1 acyl-CoA N-acyltransferase [Aspergillus sclerotioniger CBS 115572]